MNRINNDALLAVAKVWTLNGDWMTCRKCRKNLIASRDGEPLLHKTGCANGSRQHPWSELRGALADNAARPEPVEQ